MTPRLSVHILTALQSMAAILAVRGAYYFGEHSLGFGDRENLLLAVIYGLIYIAGAAISHRLTQRFGERRMLFFTLAAMLVVHTLMGALPVAWVLFAMIGPLGFFEGMMWPIVESYLTAGLPPRRTLREVGVFNVVWSSAVAGATALAGPIINMGLPQLLFLSGSVMHVICLVMALGWERRPTHLAVDHPDRPDPVKLRRYAALLVASRWAMTASYAALLMLAPLMPTLLRRLGLATEQASVVASLMDGGRFAAFVVMALLTAWYGRATPVLASLLGIPLGTAMVLLGPNLPVVIAGELILGGSAGVCYYCALYYALSVKNSAVSAGGTHETLIGIGFVVGPMLGLMGALTAGAFGSADDPGVFYLMMIMPLLMIALVAGARPLVGLMLNPPRPA